MEENNQLSVEQLLLLENLCIAKNEPVNMHVSGQGTFLAIFPFDSDCIAIFSK